VDLAQRDNGTWTAVLLSQKQYCFCRPPRASVIPRPSDLCWSRMGDGFEVGRGKFAARRWVQLWQWILENASKEDWLKFERISVGLPV
jgi:hypothetical protein